MDDAIELKKSQLEKALNILVGGFFVYSFYIVSASIPLKFGIAGLIGFLLCLDFYKNRAAKQIIGKLYCEEQGVYLIEVNQIRRYQCTLVQRLPWCLLVVFYSKDSGRFKKIIWRDALNKNDWRELRGYLNTWGLLITTS